MHSPEPEYYIPLKIAFLIAFGCHTCFLLEKLAEKVGVVIADRSRHLFYAHIMVFQQIARHIDTQAYDIFRRCHSHMLFEYCDISRITESFHFRKLRDPDLLAVTGVDKVK